MELQVIIIILGLFALVLWGSANNPQSQVSHKKYIIFMMLLLTLQSGLRNVAVGTDTYAYYLQFVEVSSTSWSNLFNKVFLFISDGTGKDPGYFLLLKIIQVFIPEFQLYLLAFAAFFFFALGRLFYRYTSNNYEVLLGVALYQCLFYSFFSITGLRQTFATAFLLLAVPYVLDRKFLKFILLVLIAGTQHKSALLFIPFYALYLFNNPKRVILYALIIFSIMWVVGQSLVSRMVSDTIFAQYEMFLDIHERAGAYSFISFILGLGLWILFSEPKQINSAKSSALFANAIAIAIALAPLLKISPANMRVVQYYSIFSTILLPVLVTLTFSIKRRTVYFLLIIFLTYYTMSRDLEYAFFWQEMELNEFYSDEN